MTEEQILKANKGRAIVRQVIHDYGIDTAEFYGESHERHLVKARREAAKRLETLGYSLRTVANIIGCSHTTVRRYRRPKEYREHADQMRARAERFKVFRLLGNSVGQLVLDIARAEGVSFDVLAAQWIRERAEYEAGAKARAA